MELVPAQALVAEQGQLGDAEDIDKRLTAQATDVAGRLASLGTGGIQNPKDVLAFVNNLTYKAVGGQQLECDCMFCNRHITSTGQSLYYVLFACIIDNTGRSALYYVLYVFYFYYL